MPTNAAAAFGGLWYAGCLPATTDACPVVCRATVQNMSLIGLVDAREYKWRRITLQVRTAVPATPRLQLPEAPGSTHRVLASQRWLHDCMLHSVLAWTKCVEIFLTCSAPSPHEQVSEEDIVLALSNVPIISKVVCD